MVPDDTMSNEEESYSEDEMEMMAEELAQAEAKEAAEREEVLNNLALDIEAKFFDRARRRTTKEGEWRKSMELYYGNLAVADQISYTKPFAILLVPIVHTIT